LFASRLEGAGLTVLVREIDEDDSPLKRGRDDGGSTHLPAAVEVAAYRIATEAMVNVSRHSGAHTCTVTLRLGHEVIVEVADDGHGLPADGQAGVGLTSMRERAAELSGTLDVDSDPTGTRITARLPFDSWASPASTPEPRRPTAGTTETRERSADGGTRRRRQENA
jgi:signal transduction histidine kinase